MPNEKRKRAGSARDDALRLLLEEVRDMLSTGGNRYAHGDLYCAWLGFLRATGESVPEERSGEPDASPRPKQDEMHDAPLELTRALAARGFQDMVLSAAQLLVTKSKLARKMGSAIDAWNKKAFAQLREHRTEQERAFAHGWLLATGYETIQTAVRFLLWTSLVHDGDGDAYAGLRQWIHRVVDAEIEAHKQAGSPTMDAVWTAVAGDECVDTSRAWAAGWPRKKEGDN